MNIEEIKKRLMKMKALANAGVGGERANAEKLLEELAARHGINLDDLEGDEVEKHVVKFSQTWQRDLFNQLMGVMRQEKAERGETLREKELELWKRRFGTKYCMVTENYTYATKCDWIELSAKFEVLKADYKRQQKSFYLAFLMANDLLLKKKEYDSDLPPAKTIKEYEEAYMLSQGITPSKLNKQLEVN